MRNVFVLLLSLSLAALSAVAEDFVIRDGNITWRFAEVSGTSQLPIEFMRTGVDLDRLESVTLPRYWIAEKPVTEGEFAEIMGRPVRKGISAQDPLASVEWSDAEEFCRKFTAKYAARLPDNTIASMPSMVEWAHAVRILEKKVDLGGSTGTFLFTGSITGGFLHTLWKDILPTEKGRSANETLASRHVVTLKRCRLENVGLRLVLVDVSKEMLGIHPIVSRGIVAMQHGYDEAAKYYLDLAIAQGNLSSDARVHAEDALECVRTTGEEALEDWSGLVQLTAAFAEGRGYETEPYASGWKMRGYRAMTDEAAVRAYRKAGIFGGWLSLSDLPREIRDGQAAEKTNVVQVVTCDFTGDGKKDLVVERYGAVGAFGYWYDFFARQTNGTYKCVYSVQSAGLCVLPRKDGRGCGFLQVEKCSDPVLAVRLLAYADGEMTSVSAHGKPFCMLDVEDNRIYAAAPFIGAANGLGWSVLEERGIWYRPLYWPWKPGRVASAQTSQKKGE